MMRKIFRNLAGDFLSVVLSLVVTLGMGSGLAAATRANTQAPADPAKYELWLTGQVQHKLAMIPWYSVFENLEYRVDGNKVTLLGQVTRPVIKIEAESSVKGIEGVKVVDNQIEVLLP